MAQSLDAGQRGAQLLEFPGSMQTKTTPELIGVDDGGVLKTTDILSKTLVWADVLKPTAVASTES
jgi:hypothetical protein